MPETSKTQAPVAAKPAAAAAPKPVADVAAPKLVDTKPVAPAAKAVDPVALPAKTPVKVVAKAVEPAVAAKRKPGRPAGSKTVKAAPPKPAVKTIAAPKAAAASVAPKPIKAKIETTTVAPLAVATSEGSRTMNDTIVKMQDTAKKFTGEATARAKGAYEKGIKMTEDMTEFQKGNVEAMVESSKLAAKAVESLGQEAADYARKSFENGTAAFKGFASAKSPTELFKLQSDYAKSYFDSMIAESSKVTEAWLKITGEIVQPLSNRVALAVDKVKATAAF